MRPYLLELAFLALGYTRHEADEKTHWTFIMTFRRKTFALIYGKFGLRTTFNGRVPEPAFLENLTYKLKGIQRQMQSKLQPALMEALAEGRVTIRNRSRLLRDRYEYFRTEALKRSNQAQSVMAVPGELQVLADALNAKSETDHQTFYYLHAMLDAYFTWAEHLLMLALPFQVELQISVKEFVRQSWSTKSHTYFNAEPDPAFRKALEDVVVLKDNYRNAITHGFVGRDNATYFAHLESYGAVPINLTALDDPSNQWLPLHSGNINEVLHVLDAFDELFMCKFRLPLIYLNNVIYIHYDPSSATRYQAALVSEEAMIQLADIDGENEDRQMNFES